MPISKTTSTPSYTSVTSDDLEIDDGTLSIDAANNRVGINTTSPGATLGVDGDLHFQPTATSTSHVTTAGSLDVRCTNNLRLGTDGADSIRIGRTNTSAAKVHIRSGSNTDLVVSDGKVGIGMEDPSDALEIDGDIQLTPTASTTAHLKATGSLDVRCDNSLKIGTNGADSVKIGRTNTTAAKVHLQSGTSTDLVVSNGRVGLGTETPSATLEVTNTSTTGVPLLQMNSNDTDQIMMDVNAANITANVFDITADGVTTADVMFISMDGATNGSALAVEDRSGSTSARDVVEIKQVNDTALNAKALSVESEGSRTAMNLSQTYRNANACTTKALAMTVEKETATTTDNTIYGIDLDLDNTTATNGTNTMVGISVTPTLTHAADAGTTTVKGIAITATGGTNGTATTTGLDLTATGADTNMGIVTTVADGGTDIRVNSSADTGDYFSIATTTHGATTIATVDDDATAAHLTLDVDGDITLDADGGTITFADGGSSLGTITSSGFSVSGAITAQTSSGGSVHGAGADSVNPYVKVRKINDEVVTTVSVDLGAGAGSKVFTSSNMALGRAMGHHSGGTGSGAAFVFGPIAKATHGLVYHAEMVCLETPAGGSADIDIIGTTTATHVFNAAVSGTAVVSAAGGHAEFTSSKTSSGNTLTGGLDGMYLYLCTGDTSGTHGNYSAGKFDIVLKGRIELPDGGRTS